MTQILSQQHWIKSARGQLFAQSWVPTAVQGEPLVLLHDSLGCVALWRDFPERLAHATRRRVIAYDRLGFGRSDAHPGLLTASFVQDEVHQDFQALCQQLELNKFVVVGHSVGGGMAVSCAVANPQRCEGLITESAQAFADPATLDSIRLAKHQFAKPDQLERLKKYHGDKASWVLHAWIDTWLSDAFSQWNLDSQLPHVKCPTLILHGDRDEYGSIHHPERIAAMVSGQATMRMLENCGHVPHREYPEEVLAAITDFLTPALMI